MDIKDALLTDEEISVIWHSFEHSLKNDHSWHYRLGTLRVIAKDQLDSPELQDYINEQVVEAVKAERKQIGLELQSKIGGLDEFIDWSDEGLREFRKMTLSTTKEILQALSEGESEK